MKKPAGAIPAAKLRSRGREALITTILALLFTKIPLVFLLVPILELTAAIRASRANTLLRQQGERTSVAGHVAAPLGAVLFVVTGFMAAATLVETYEAMSRARESRSSKYDYNNVTSDPGPSRPPVVTNPAEMVATNRHPEAAAPPLPITRKVVVEVNAHTWQEPAKDVTKPLGEVLAKNGIGVAVDASGADAIVAVRYDETKGEEFRAMFGNGTSMGFGTDFKVAVDVLDTKDRHSRAKFEISRRMPGSVQNQDLRSAGFEALASSPELALLGTAIAAAAGDATATARMLPALTAPDKRYEASAMLTSLRFRPTTPREAAYVAIGKGRFEAAMKLGPVGVELLVELLDATWGYSDDSLAIARVVAKTHDPVVVAALERALTKLAEATTPESYWDGTRLAEMIELLASASEGRALVALGRNCIATDYVTANENLKELLGKILPKLYKKVRSSSSAKPTVALHVTASGWATTRFDIERAIRTQLAAVNITIAPEGSKEIDGIVDLFYEETEGDRRELTTQRAATNIAWSIVVVDPAHQRARMLGGRIHGSEGHEGDDPQAFAIEQLKTLEEFRRIGTFVTDTLTGELKEPDSCAALSRR